MDKLKSLDIHFQDIPLTPNQPREWAYHKRIAKDTATLKSLCIHFPAMLWFHIFFCGTGTGTSTGTAYQKYAEPEPEQGVQKNAEPEPQY